jgi:hypothetical protein
LRTEAKKRLRPRVRGLAVAPGDRGGCRRPLERQQKPHHLVIEYGDEALEFAIEDEPGMVSSERRHHRRSIEHLHETHAWQVVDQIAIAVHIVGEGFGERCEHAVIAEAPAVKTQRQHPPIDEREPQAWKLVIGPQRARRDPQPGAQGRRPRHRESRRWRVGKVGGIIFHAAMMHGLVAQRVSPMSGGVWLGI